MIFLKTLNFILLLTLIFIEINAKKNKNLTESQVNGYHFHTYFFQSNHYSIDEALKLRQNIELKINKKEFSDCIVSTVYDTPRGPHPLGNFVTCCNKTSLWRALPWFMQNHGNLSVLLHGLTRNVLSDHSERAIFLGKVVPLDLTRYELPTNDSRVLECIPEDI